MFLIDKFCKRQKKPLKNFPARFDKYLSLSENPNKS